MEALNDIGASEFLGVSTLTVSIYTTWVTRSDLPGAAQIALSLLAWWWRSWRVERWARREQRYSISAQRSRYFEPRKVSAIKGLLLFGLGLLPVLIGFVAPAGLSCNVKPGKESEFAGLSSRFLDEAVKHDWSRVHCDSHDVIFRSCSSPTPVRLRPGRHPRPGFTGFRRWAMRLPERCRHRSSGRSRQS